ncbi:hypothetical protein [Haliangium sp.]|uniref:hypothetical protein n=1 Tax=Haliangium sp. TaxID=2663208 RepID=UPI003D13854C
MNTSRLYLIALIAAIFAAAGCAADETGSKRLGIQCYDTGSGRACVDAFSDVLADDAVDVDGDGQVDTYVCGDVPSDSDSDEGQGGTEDSDDDDGDDADDTAAVSAGLLGHGGDYEDDGSEDTLCDGDNSGPGNDAEQCDGDDSSHGDDDADSDSDSESDSESDSDCGVSDADDADSDSESDLDGDGDGVPDELDCDCVPAPATEIIVQ